MPKSKPKKTPAIAKPITVEKSNNLSMKKIVYPERRSQPYFRKSSTFNASPDWNGVMVESPIAIELYK